MKVNNVGIGIALFCPILGVAQRTFAQPSSSVCGTTSSGKQICVRFDNLSSAPQADFDFTFDLASDPSNPKVELLRGRNTSGTLMEWRVWCKDSSNNPANIGEIKAISDYDFQVKVLDASDNAGAATVGSINLDPSGANKYSNLTGGSISGNLTGTFFLQKSSGGSGGEVNGEILIEGNLSGNMTFPTLAASLNIGGDVSGDITISHRIEGAGLAVVGVVEESATINIADMVPAGGVDAAASFCTDFPSSFAGDLVLESGLAEDQQVIIWGALQSTASIDLNDEVMAGRLLLMGGGSGVLTGFADVTDELRLVHLTNHLFSGTATFDQVSTGAVLTGNIGSVDGTIIVTGDMGGVISIIGDFLSSGEISIGGTATGTIDVVGDAEGDIEVTGDLEGDIDIGGAFTSTAKIDINGNLTSSADVTIGGTTTGDVAMDGNLAGDIAQSGTVAYGCVVSIGGDLTGTVTASQSFSGDVAVGDDVTGSITIAHSLTTTGRILITGMCDGTIHVGRETGSSSLILATEGLDDNGEIVVNSSAGSYNANGSIYIGQPNYSSIGSVTFDGTIWLRGALNGSITVVGCHATADPLDICICGGGDDPAISIIQDGCTNQVSWECVSELCG